jgi:predicted transcriptional regulator
MVVVISYQKSKRSEHKTHYDSLYDALSYLSYYPIPLTKYRIATNKQILFSLLSNQFIQEVTDKNLLLNSEYNDVPHYVISPKGMEYVKRYESLKELLV